MSELYDLKRSSLFAARIYHQAVSEWVLNPQSVELGTVCLLAAKAYRDRLHDQLQYLLSMEGEKSEDENVTRTRKLIELITTQIEIGFKP